MHLTWRVTILGFPLRGLGALAVASLLAGVALGSPAAALGSPADAAGYATGGAADAWLVPPAPLRIAAPFDRPTSDWGPGHRGIDVWLTAGSIVNSPGDGVVTFAGRIAGRGVVVVTHPSGLRSTLEPVTASGHVGDEVRMRDPIGALELVGSHCVPRACLHWGVRRGDNYVDPLDVTRGFGPIRLLPLRD